MVMGALERLNPPRVLGDMTLLATLGEGGMATVYLASQGSGNLARLAAVKLLRGDLPDHDYRTRFLDEAKVVVRLHHNNLVDVRAAGEQGDQLYIAMEAIEGRDLADVWDRCADRGKAFPVPLAVHACREVLRGLHYAHTFPGLGLVHRDVSPSNILIDWAGAVRLADFGLATSTLKASMTMPGVVFGKVGYMSPEQALRKPLDGRVDVYAVGVVLWELLTGKPMRAADGLDTDKVADFEAKPPSLLSKRVDAELDSIVMRALTRDRNDRWATAEAMMKALGRWLATRAPETGQEAMAAFMNTLFGDDIDRERDAREDLLRRAVGGQSGTSKTRLFIREATDPLEELGGDRESRADRAQSATRISVDTVELLPAGMVIAERYRVLSKLGRGGMGTVYLGEHVTVGRSVAIKVLTHEWSENEGITQRFRAEARAASAAGHPNIVEVFDAGELPDGRLFLVMEFLTGRNLFEEVQAVGPLGVARACHVIRDVARAIRAAHEVGIIHRDLKPDNVMLVDRGRGEGETVKVLDFGISASADRSSGEERLTVAGQALGTPHYMAPEQARGREPTEQFDIYAMGVIFFELLTGRTPFEGANIVEVMARKSLEPAPSLGELREGVPPELVTLVDDCLQIDPDKRPASARVFLAHLDDILRGLPRGSAPAASGEHSRVDDPSSSRDSELVDPETDVVVVEEALPSAKRGPPRLAILGLVGGLAAAGAVLIFWSATRDDGPSGPEVLAAAEPEVEASQPPAGEVPAKTHPDLAPEPPARVGAQDPIATADVGAAAPEATPGTPGTGPETSEAVPSAAAVAAPQPSAPSPWSTGRCAEVRARAEAAEADRSWSSLLKKLSPKNCWKDRKDRQRMQVRALKELGRFAECAEAGKGATEPKVKGWTTLCAKRAAMEQGG